MSLRLFLVAIILISLFVSYFALENPGMVRVNLPAFGSYEVTLPFLTLISFVAGAILVFLLTTISDVQRTLTLYRATRKARRDERIAEIYAEGMSSLLSKRLGAAKPVFRKILLKDPQNIHAFLRLGEIHRQEGDYNEAIRLHSKAREIEPWNLEALMNLALDYEKAERMDEAIGVLEKIRDKFKDNLPAHQKLRELYINQNNWEKAFSVQREILKLCQVSAKDDPEYQTLVGLKYELGRAKQKERSFREAAKAFREGAKLDKQFTPAYLALGETYRQSGHREKAVRIWERAFYITRSGVFLKELEHLHLEQEQPDRIIAFYHQALLKKPDDLLLKYHLGKLLKRLEMVEEAFAQFQLLVREVPSYPLSYFHLAEIYERRGQYLEAAQNYREALKLSRGPLYECRCLACGAWAQEWRDRCSSCGRWNSLGDELRRSIKAHEPTPSPIPLIY